MGSIAADYIKVSVVGAAGAATFPAAAALSDDLANPTTTGVAAYVHGYDASGNQWERCRVSADRILQVAAGTAAVPSDTMSNSELGGLFGPNGPGRALYVGGAQYSDIAGNWARARNYTTAAFHSGAVTLDTVSGTAFDSRFYRTISVFGTAGAAGTMRIWFSDDDATYYASSHSAAQTTIGGTHYLGLTFDAGARYIKFSYTTSTTLTLRIGAKGI